ncbi:MAG: hypothetical protein V1748_09900 [Actinomycetota bacterium]
MSANEEPTAVDTMGEVTPAGEETMPPEHVWYRSTWFRWVIAIVIIALLCGLAAVIWKRPLRNARARQKAQELHDRAEALGFPVPSVETLAGLYGVDGGATAETANSDISRAMLAYNIGRSGEVNQRPNIIDPRLLEFEWLVLQVYRPEEAAKYKDFIDSLKLEETINQ